MEVANKNMIAQVVRDSGYWISPETVFLKSDKGSPWEQGEYVLAVDLSKWYSFDFDQKDAGYEDSILELIYLIDVKHYEENKDKLTENLSGRREIWRLFPRAISVFAYLNLCLEREGDGYRLGYQQMRYKPNDKKNRRLEKQLEDCLDSFPCEPLFGFPIFELVAKSRELTSQGAVPFLKSDWQELSIYPLKPTEFLEDVEYMSILGKLKTKKVPAFGYPAVMTFDDLLHKDQNSPLGYYMAIAGYALKVWGCWNKQARGQIGYFGPPMFRID